MVSSRATRRPRRAPRRKARLSRRGGRVAVLGLVGLAIFIVLLVAAFSSSAPPFQASVKGVPIGRPLPQIVAFQGPLRIQLPISQREVTALGYHGTDGSALALQ